MYRSVKSAVCSVLFCGSLLVSPSLIVGQDTHSAPDNTATNKQDRNSSQPTADQGKNNTSDREIMRNIRRDVVKDKSLSTYAHNVKIISEHGKVTLRGPVHSEAEKKAIEDYATKYAGAGNVTNELTVKSDQK